MKQDEDKFYNNIAKQIIDTANADMKTAELTDNEVKSMFLTVCGGEIGGVVLAVAKKIEEEHGIDGVKAIEKILSGMFNFIQYALAEENGCEVELGMVEHVNGAKSHVQG